MKLLKVGIVGSRSRNTEEDKDLIRQVLIRRLSKNDRLHIVSGGCPKGADRFAEELAEELGLGTSIHYPQTYPHMSKWEYAKSCYERNTLIADECDLLVVLWDGVSGGTKDTIRKAEAQGKGVVYL